MKSNSDHEKLFDEICGKLTEFSWNRKGTENSMASEQWNERIERMQNQLKKSHDELKAAQDNLQAKIGTLENFTYIENDLQTENQRLTTQMDQERQTNSKLNADLAKSLELNLKLQFEIEEIRAKANQVLAEEKRHNLYLQEKNKTLSHELELAQALCQETRLELGKARDRFQMDQQQWLEEKTQLESQINDSIGQFENHTMQQNDLMKNLSIVAEKKIVELKMALDKKSLEAQDYYSHLQQSLSQSTILRQENSALKDYIGKLTALHQNTPKELST